MDTRKKGKSKYPPILSDPKRVEETGSRLSWRTLAFSFLVFSLFLGALEVVLRSTHLFNARISWAEPDPTLGWKNTPGKTYWNNKENDHPISGKINSYGFRDKEWSLEKENGVYRIAVLGDSYVEAIQVESDKTFLSLAEKKLSNNNSNTVELMNFGQSGFTQTHELIVLKDSILQFSPDLLILLFVPSNDIQDISRATAGSLQSPFLDVDVNGELVIDTLFNKSTTYKIKSLINPIKQNSAMISLMIERYNVYKFMRAMNATNKRSGLSRYLTLATDKPDPAFLKSYNLNKRAIKLMIDICTEHNVDFMLISINSSDTYIPEVDRKYIAMEPSFNHGYFEDDLSDFSTANKVQYLGLQRLFRDNYENNAERLHWGHWNYRGHEVVAAALTEKLKEIINR